MTFKEYLKILLLVISPLLAVIGYVATIVCANAISDFVVILLAYVTAAVLAFFVIKWIEYLVDKEVL